MTQYVNKRKYPTFVFSITPKAASDFNPLSLTFGRLFLVHSSIFPHVLIPPSISLLPMKSLPSFSFELRQLPADRQTGKQALGDGVMVVVLMGDGGEGAKNSVPRMSTPTHVHIDLCTHTHTHAHTGEPAL